MTWLSERPVSSRIFFEDGFRIGREEEEEEVFGAGVSLIPQGAALNLEFVGVAIVISSELAVYSDDFGLRRGGLSWALRMTGFQEEAICLFTVGRGRMKEVIGDAECATDTKKCEAGKRD